MKMLFSSLSVLLVCSVFSQVLGEAPKSTMQELIKEGQEKFDKTWDDVRKQIGLSEKPTGEEIVKVVREQNDKLATSLKEFGKNIEETIKKNPDATNLLNTIKTKINEAADGLKKENPEIASNAQKLGETMKSAWDTLSQDMEKGYKEFNKKGGKRDDIEEIFKTFIDKGTATVNELKTKVEEAIKKN